jgi:polar amino acid transport system substrate-binding protein
MNGVKGKLTVVTVVFLVLLSSEVLATKLNIVTEHLPPYQIATEGSITGLSTEIVEATLKESQYTYDIEAYPWALSFGRAKHHKNTCIHSLARIPQRESLFKWIGFIAETTSSLYALQNSLIVIDNLEEAKKYNIAVIRSDIAHHFLLTKGFVENKNIYVTDNDAALLKLLDVASRNVDLIVFDDYALQNRVNNLAETSKYKSVFKLKGLTLNLYLACSLNTDQKIVDELIDTMKVLEKRGVFRKIRDKWKNIVN